jgi:hypothetical protein
MLYNGDTGAWDAVVTCFFIDTAHNIVEYIEIISQILKDGGVSSLIEIQIDLVYLFFSSRIHLFSCCHSHFNIILHTG